MKTETVQTFAEITAEPISAPFDESAAHRTRGRVHGGANGPVFEDLNGKIYAGGVEATPEEAQQLALTGATLAYDDAAAGVTARCLG